MKRKVKKFKKLVMESKVGILLWILVGVFVLYFLLHTTQPLLYMLVIAGTPFLFYIKSQDWLPYIYGGIVLALGAQLVLGFFLHTRLPVVAVVSGSMEHGVASSYPCGRMMNNYVESFDNWWELCKQTYEPYNITKEEFLNFPFKDGLKVGDMAVVQGSDRYSVGDIIVYHVNEGPPIIHRVVKVNEDGTYQTKGDHNQIPNPSYELSISKEQIEGRVIFVIPKLGYVKVFISRLFGV